MTVILKVFIEGAMCIFYLPLKVSEYVCVGGVGWGFADACRG